MSEQKVSKIDERFTRIADIVTEFVGRWWFTAVSLLLLIAWIIYGIIAIPNWFTSATWNFPANSITTLGEWFMEGLILAAANRVERRHDVLLETIKARTTADVETTRKNEQDIQEIRADMQTIKGLLAKGVSEP